MDLSTSILSDITVLYLAGSTLDTIAKKYNTTRYKVRNVLLKNEITIRKKATQYVFNTSAFDKIDSQEKAYWLGFIYADGCVQTKNNGSNILMLTLGVKDVEHLKMFCGFLLLDISKVKIYGNVCHLEISSNDLVDDLIKHGVNFRKTFTLTYPKIDESLQRHFIRGYFDGDGCITKDGCLLKVTSTYDFLYELQNQLIKSVGITKTKIIKENNFFNLYKNGRLQVSAIGEFMYENATVYLNRKERLFIKRKN